MNIIKCPRCELNYIIDGGTLCNVCRKEVRGEYEQTETEELCQECNERPVVPGHDLCAYCLKLMNQNTDTDTDDAVAVNEASISIDSLSTMEEIDIVEIDKKTAMEYGAEDEFVDDDDDDEEKKDDENEPMSLEQLAEEEEEDESEADLDEEDNY